MNRVLQNGPPRILSWGAALLLFGAAMGSVQAAGTAQGTTVSNSATVNFSVGGIVQPGATSNTVTFVVDRRVNMTVAEIGGLGTIVSPNSTNQVTAFTVTNTTNGTQDFRLAATQDATGATTAFSDTDSFDASNVRVFVESGATLGYQAAQDTATFIDELAADASRTVYVVVDIPSAVANTDTAGVTLTAIAAQSTNASGGYVATAGVLASDSAQTNTGSADNPNFVDTVFGDGAGDTGDVARDGRHSDDDEYDVLAATLLVSKSQTVISDPFNNTTNPKAIPGAVIEYCIDIDNTGGGTGADVVVITDAIPANTTYVASSIRTDVTGAGAACTSGTGNPEDDDANDALEINQPTADYNVSSPNTVTVRVLSVAIGARFKMLFRATVN